MTTQVTNADEEDKESKPSKKVHVHQYRQILMMPLHLDVPAEMHKSGDSQFAACKKELKKTPWGKPKKQLTPDCCLEKDNCYPKEVNAPRYEEMVYFFPHVRDFLFGTNTYDQSKMPIQRFSRDDLKKVTVQLKKDSPEINFNVDRTELYLGKPSLAILVVELSYESDPANNKDALSLDEVLNLQSAIRQAYPPFFYPDDNEIRGGNCPYKVTFRFEGDEKIDSDFVNSKEETIKHFHRTGEPPIGGHWQSLLKPFKHFDREKIDHTDKNRGITYQQFLDDRLPGMTYLAVDDPLAIREGDFYRLAYCDEAGEGEYFFSEKFLKENNSDIFYDRFWDPESESKTIRHLCSGYQYVVVGKDDSQLEKDKQFFTTHLKEHFRRHYFWMGFILHYQRATLLRFANDLNIALKELHSVHPADELDDTGFQKAIHKLQMDMVKFKSRAWFHEVSNQLQPQEMYELWFRKLRNQTLYDYVVNRTNDMYEAMAEYESRSLTRIAFYIAPPALVLTLCQIALSYSEYNTLFSKYPLGHSVFWAFGCLLSIPITFKLMQWTRKLFG